MTETTPLERTCFHHRDRVTGRTCTRCDRPACSDCLTPAPVGAHCWECIKAARPPVRQRLRGWNARANLLVTNVLIAANVAVFLGGLAWGARPGPGTGDGLVSSAIGRIHLRFAVDGPTVAAGQWYRLVTSGFVHFGVLHLALNMAVLYQLGNLLEPELGRVRFAALYLACLLAGSFGALLVSPDSLTAGASGAIFGLLGAAAAGLRLRGYSIWRTPLGGLIVVNLVFTFAVPGISIGGHLGGLAAGALLGTVMLRDRTTRSSMLRGLAAAAVVAAVAVAGSLWWSAGVGAPGPQAMPSSSALLMASGRPLTPSLR